jgi:squalene-hopene/tetraprenyl-beta-curcumene cyclase
MTSVDARHIVERDGDQEPAAAAALQRAVEFMLARQDPVGWWRGELETNVTIEAEDLLMRQFLGVRTAEQTEQTARWIRRQQRDDGSWANFPGGPADASTTAEAYLALRLAGDPAGALRMLAARDVVLAAGGLQSTRVFTRFWLALFGLGDWDEVPALPPELIYLPSWFPLNLYDFACWARQTIAPLTVLTALRPRHSLGFDVDELRPLDAPSPTPRRGWAAAFSRLDRLLHRYEQHPLRRLRRRALERMADWIVARQEADGSWGGIQPPWVYSLMALHALGRPADGPVIERGLAGWDRFTVVESTPTGPLRRLEACQSPVWDTALAMVALGDAGLLAGHPALERAADWLVSEEITVRGDWAVRRKVPPGGWAFEFDNDGYPDIDDTAEVVLGLRRARPTPEREAAIQRAVSWVRAMRCRAGGWAAFDADNTREFAYQLPFCDFGAVIDPPSADVTAHVLEMLAATGAGPAELQDAVDWLLHAQEPDGSWFGRWGANYIYGTGAVVPALVAAGVPTDSKPVQQAMGWLLDHQNRDGGWGEDLRSYTDPAWRGRGASTPSQTAWALLGLLATDAADHPATRAGVGWLVAHQRIDGSWDEPYATGTGFPGDFYLSYHLYRLVFPVSALGRYLGSRS